MNFNKYGYRVYYEDTSGSAKKDTANKLLWCF